MEPEHRKSPFFTLSIVIASILVTSSQAYVPWTRSGNNCGPSTKQSSLPATVATLTRVAVSKNSNSNEFSRCLEPDRILKSRRDYLTTIEATLEECQLLANRFDLPNLSSLRADLVLRREGRTEGSKVYGVEVEGTLTADVTRVCVRSNEQFTILAETPIYSIVRPVLPLATISSSSLSSATDSATSIGAFAKDDEKKKTSPNRKESNRSKDQVSNPSIDEMDLMQLQRFIITEEDDFLMEDESIYTLDGNLDVGELVAQLFWLSLDPYPKKPGSEPVRFTITG